MRRRLLLTLAAMFCFLSCSKDENLYSTAYICRFLFRANYHTESLLARVLNNNPGLFVKVTVQKRNGIWHLVVNSSGGNTDEDVALTTEIEKRFDYSNVGANQCIIIGCTTTNECKAYDAQCPYCLENYSGVNFPLTWTNNGNSVQCAKCSRTYNLNYDGISPEDGTRLLQYRVAWDGTNLSVNNG